MRTYSDSSDLKRMQKLTQARWSLQSNYHIGDLAWQRNRHAGREDEWITAIWEVNDKPVAWGWVKLPGSLMIEVDPDFAELAKDVIDWFDQVTDTNEQKVTVLETESHIMSALEDVSFNLVEEPPEVLAKISLENCPFPVNLQDGFTARHLKGEVDVPKRVGIQGAAFPHSRVTEESYRNVMNAYPYDSSLDWVIEAPNGEFAACCLIWFDEVNKVGLLEPVGAGSELLENGVSSSVCKLAINALSEKGADTAIVVCTSPKTHAFYKSIGFVPYAETKSFHRLKNTLEG